MKNITEITAKQQEAKIIRLAAYCRVSSDSEDQLHSFAAQIRYYTEYTQRNTGYRLVDIYSEDRLSEKKPIGYATDNPPALPTVKV